MVKRTRGCSCTERDESDVLLDTNGLSDASVILIPRNASINVHLEVQYQASLR